MIRHYTKLFKPLGAVRRLRNMPPAKFDPLSNPRTSQVLFLLVKGVDTPTSLAEILKIKPPSVMEQLARLRKISVVVPGKKTGKEQHYSVNWAELAEESVKHTLAPRYAPGVFGPRDSIPFVMRYPQFETFLRSYFEDYLAPWNPVSHVDRPPRHHARAPADMYQTVWFLVDGLFATLTNFVEHRLFTKVLVGDSSLKPFSECLSRWVEMGKPVDPHAVVPLFQTLKHLGFRLGDARLAAARFKIVEKIFRDQGKGQTRT